MDGDVRDAIATVLQEDSVLVAMLGKNYQWFDKEQEHGADKKWSIVPVTKFNASNELPQITVQMGGDNRIGTRLYETLVYIRCYNSSDKTHVEITQVLARVQELLDRVNIDLSGSTTIELRHDATQGDMVDQAFELPYRESRYRWQRI
jgi:hypothetical protein